MRSVSSRLVLILSGSGLALTSGLAMAITVTPSQDATQLTNALLSGANTGIVVTSSTLSGHQESLSIAGLDAGTLTSSGSYANTSGTYGIGPGVVISTGSVNGISMQGIPLFPGYGDGPNTVGANGYPFGSGFDIGAPPDPENPPALGTPATAAQELILDPITGDPATQTYYDHYDVTELLINFDMQAGFNSVAFNIVFGSEEYPEFVGSPFVDGFGMFLNGTNIAQVGGKPVNINHPDVTDIAGTELDGVLAPNGNPVLTFSGLVNPTGNSLRFIVADTSDGVYDTTVYLSALKGVSAPEVPLPASGLLLGTAAIGLAARGRLLRRRKEARQPS